LITPSPHGRENHPKGRRHSCYFGVTRHAAPSITVVDATNGLIRITIANEKTATLECGRYIDALQLTIGDVVSPLWTGVILVAANPRRALSNARAAICISKAVVVGGRP